MLRKITIMVLTVLSFLMLLGGCNSKTVNVSVPEEIVIKNRGDNKLDVLLLSVNEKEGLTTKSIGYSDESGFYLTEPRLNGHYFFKEGAYHYDATINYKADTENAKGILVYKGLIYSLVEESGKDYLILISDNTYNDYRKKYELNDFLSRAAKFFNDYGGVTSGGNGLAD